MTANRILLAVVPPLMMIGIALALPGIEQWLADVRKNGRGEIDARPDWLGAALCRERCDRR